MTQEDKELLLKDLCARLPFGVKFLRESWNYEWDQELSVIEILEAIDKDGYINNSKVYKVRDIKPYLRPMSSMTEEEKMELSAVLIHACTFRNSAAEIDWLNKKMFDFRGLIPKDLALSTETFNPYKD